MAGRDRHDQGGGGHGRAARRAQARTIGDRLADGQGGGDAMIIRILAVAVAFIAFIIPAHAATKPIVVKSPGGIEAWLIEDHGLPALAVSIGFVGGATREAKGKEGSGTLLTMMLDEGAGQYDSRAFKQQLADRSI